MVYATNAMKLELTPEDKRRLLDAYLHLTPWPDTHSNVENAGLSGFFDALVSTDANHTYKPDQRAYRLGMERLHLAKQDILFAAFGGLDGLLDFVLSKSLAQKG